MLHLRCLKRQMLPAVCCVLCNRISQPGIRANDASERNTGLKKAFATGSDVCRCLAVDVELGSFEVVIFGNIVGHRAIGCG